MEGNNNTLHNNLSSKNNEYPSNSQQISDVQAGHSSYLSVMSNNNNNNFPAHTNISDGPNYQRYDSSNTNNNTTITPSQPTSNDFPNNGDNIPDSQQYDASNNASYHNYQLFMFTSNNAPPPQHVNVNRHLPRSNVLPCLNYGININCHKTKYNINITTNSDIQQNLQQILDHWSNNSQTRSQQ
ncbi:hypothetical protein RclHR1_02030010 [Rhizophagus clarus]|uniref:Uncharacterized protein n=1 Tax=Rhizophagus clarus TaxID=94130 RepID=A0A2Z6QR60_9GLOM|nr:hypothetical protein RclHR1_02030010 [Rhizophagus clarus]GES98158.1 hypothetical protein GLOIN_2v1489596 [Rhizophagus clarus]